MIYTFKHFTKIDIKAYTAKERAKIIFFLSFIIYNFAKNNISVIALS